MNAAQSHTPAEDDAAALFRAVTEENVESIERFPTGLSGYVYDVTSVNGKKLVVRMTRPEYREILAGAVYWSERLRPRGIPLPRIMHNDIDACITPFPALLLERLPGTDLWHVYSDLSTGQKKALAAEIVRIQHKIGDMPLGNGFGDALSYDGPFPCRSWSEVVHASLERSRFRIDEVGVVDPSYVDRVQDALPPFEGYFSSVKPRAFLDDTTTKNVIVHEGRMSGIVDVDWVCFGDPLFTVALTRMSLLNLHHDLDYIEFWCEHLKLGKAERRVLDFYTCLFCVGFLSELGQAFNKDEADRIDPDAIAHLTDTLDGLLLLLPNF
jgi:aminoglycoside phosphotransferase (APT) family kinase protein